jgi:ADP-ribose pyrophosphatase YjhB (NUDIX family)
VQASSPCSTISLGDPAINRLHDPNQLAQIAATLQPEGGALRNAPEPYDRVPERADFEGRRVSRGLNDAIRPIAAAVIRNEDRILVWEDHDPTTGDVVAVPLAGGIEFGETGQAAIGRELQEEVGATPTRVRYLGLLEDIFVWAGQKRHELYLIYDVELAGRTVYEAEKIRVVEPDGTSYLARWRPLSEFRGPARLVPDGLLELIEQSLKSRTAPGTGGHGDRF